MTGTIKRLVIDRRFGFIRGDGETQDYFFHSSGVADGGFSNLYEDAHVAFEVEHSDRGPRATAVRLAEG